MSSSDSDDSDVQELRHAELLARVTSATTKRTTSAAAEHLLQHADSKTPPPARVFDLLRSRTGSYTLEDSELLCSEIRDNGYAVLRLPEDDCASVERSYAAFQDFLRAPPQVKATLEPDEEQGPGVHLDVGDLGYRRVRRDEFLDLREEGDGTTMIVGPVSKPVSLAAPDLAAATGALLQVMTGVAGGVLGTLANTFGLDQEAFCDPVIQGGYGGTVHMPGACLRMCHYHPGGEEDSKLAFKEHTDTTVITLALCSSEPGLEVRSKGRWVQPEAGRDIGCMVLFPGEFLQIITQGYLPATQHRVMRPRHTPRLSIPCLIRASPKGVLNTKRYIERALEEATQDGRGRARKGPPGPHNVLPCEHKTMQWLWNYANGW